MFVNYNKYCWTSKLEILVSFYYSTPPQLQAYVVTVQHIWAESIFCLVSLVSQEEEIKCVQLNSFVKNPKN
jgi:hypothetical protein